MPTFKGQITSSDFANTLGDEHNDGEDEDQEEQEEEESELSKDLLKISDEAAAFATSALLGQPTNTSKDEDIAPFEVGKRFTRTPKSGEKRPLSDRKSPNGRRNPSGKKK